MPHYRLLIVLLLLSVVACDGHNTKNKSTIKKTRVSGVEFATKNSSDSTLYIDYMGFNNQFSISPARFRKCSFGINFSGGGRLYSNIEPPTSIEATWEHELTNSYYKVTIPLHQNLSNWLLDPKTLPVQRTLPPGEYPDKYPSIIVTFREKFHVEAWMVFYGDQPIEQTAIKLGEAVGVKYEPEFKVHVSGVSYRDMAGDFGSSYILRPGKVLRYSREFDQELSKSERYGCFHDDNYMHVKEKQAYKYGLLVGLKGELINCRSEDCSDNPLRNQWREMLRKKILKTSDYTKENPYPLRIHPKLTADEFKAYVKQQNKYRTRNLASKVKSWVCLNPPEPCFKGFYKYYPAKIISKQR